MHGKVSISWTSSIYPDIVAAWRLKKHPSLEFHEIDVGVPQLLDTAAYKVLHSEDLLDAILCLETDAGLKEFVELNESKLLKDWISWWIEALRRSRSVSSSSQARLSLIVPTQSGHILRTDIFETRLFGHHSIEAVWSNLEPCQFVTGYGGLQAAQEQTNPTQVFGKSICGVLFNPTRNSNQTSQYDEILYQRLSLPLAVSTPVAYKRIALVEGGFNFDFRRDLLKAAGGLGIRLVVLDRPGHWLQKSDFASFLESFIPVDINIDDGLPQRLVDVLNGYPLQIDGITTITDRYLCPTAIAARLLSLPSSPFEALEACVNKSRTRELVPIPGTSVATFTTENALAAPVEAFKYPVIVKPSRGAGSFGVFLAKNPAEVVEAQSKICAWGRDGVIEPYLEGPEVDVNIVLQDRKVVFCEISDDLPCTAEGFPTQFHSRSWTETGNVFPSGLPDIETAKLQEETTCHLLRLGFTDGVFHCEARVQNSHCTYQNNKAGWPALTANTENREPKPSVAMIEFNARPPGFTWSAPSAYAYGVDYYALHLLSAVDDKLRFKALSIPYRNGPAGWWESAFVPAEQGGVFHSTCMFEELLVTAPRLMRSVVRHITFFREGDTIKDPILSGKVQWVAWFVVHSNENRRHLEDIVGEIRAALKFTVTEE